MSRRRLVVLVSAGLLGVIILVALVAAVSITQTPYGRELVRRVIVAQLAGAVQGRLHIGAIGGNLLTGITIDSLELRDPTDSVFVATGPVIVAYDPRDLIDRRLLFHRVEVHRPVVRLARGADGEWNFRRIFRGRSSPAPPRPRGSFGDVIIADSVIVHGGRFTLVMPWRPDPALEGAARDSSIAYHLQRDDLEILAADTGYVRRWHWRDIDARLSHARIAHPDSVGQRFVVGALAVVESDPPFDVRDIRGDVQIRGDSVFLEVPYFRLPGSIGSGEGKIWWGSGLPTRYDIHVRGDTVSLADVSWVYPTLPREGGGSMRLHIRNNPDNLRIVEYALSDLDVSTTQSRLRGTMTYGVGPGPLRVTDVDLSLEPVDFALLETLAGGPFPLPWRGTLTGTVRGPGGPLDRFRVDSGNVVFADANVPGAVSRVRGRGLLDITNPADAIFLGFDVTVDNFDLRTAQALNPEFPRLRGVVSGTATLDSIWTDVRVRNLDLVHRDGQLPHSRITGGGRVTLEERYVRYDLDIVADSLSFTTLSASYAAVPLRGYVTGPLQVRGTIADLEVTGRLTGDAGILHVNARVDGEPPHYAASGAVALEAADLSTLLDRLDIPPTTLSLGVAGEVRGSSGADATGELVAALSHSLVDQVRVDTGQVRIRLGDGRLMVDSLELESEVASVRASGALGITPGVGDTLTFHLAADSLGVLRRYLTASTDSAALADSMTGRVRLDARFIGTLAAAPRAGDAELAPDSDTADAPGLGVRATLAARGIGIPGLRAARLDADVRLDDLRGRPYGLVRAWADSSRFGRYRVTSANGSLRLDGPGEGRLTIATELTTRASMQASAAFLGEAKGTRFFLDSLSAQVRPGGETDSVHHWSLARPATLFAARSGLVADTIELRGPGNARLLAAGTLPVIDSLDALLVAERVPLRDVGAIAQVPVPLAGTASLTLIAHGVRDAPRFIFDGRTVGARVGDVQISELRVRGDYDRRRLTTELALARSDAVLLRARADIPVDLALVPRERRVLDAPLSGYVQADRADLAVLEAFTTRLRDVDGVFTVNARLGGTPANPRVDGALSIAGGAASIPELGTVRLRDVDADIRFLGDSVEVRGVTAASGTQRSSSLLLRGGMGFTAGELPRLGLELQLRDFHIIGRPRLADLDVSTTPNLRLRGPLDALVLTGGVRVERGTVYLPELTGKQVIALDDPELYTIVDTTQAENRRLFPAAPAVVSNLTLRDVEVAMGEEVWLRGPEANVNLGGRLRLTTTTQAEGGERPLERLALDGVLTADRGTYRLNLGVVQRTFQIEQGTVRFFGDPEFNPSLDIRALYTVRRVDPRAAQPDVRVRAIIGGTLADPELTIGGADDTQLTESDALSYLVLGVPSLQVGGVQQSNQQTATALAITSLGSYLTDRAAGGLFDYVTFETGGMDSDEASFSATSQTLLAGSRLGVGLQVSERAFVSVNAGLCQVVDAAYGRGFRATDFAGALGVKLDYQLSPVLIFSAGVEPGATALYCRSTDAARGFAPTPQQWTFDLFRTWRF